MRITIPRRIQMYFAVFGVFFALWVAAPAVFRPRAYSIPSSKLVSYADHKSDYKLVFIGDSRTYTDIQPRVIDPIIGRPSYNMASFGLWLPLQYLEFRDAFKEIPAGTVVVWSLSHLNLAPVGDRWWIPGQYKFTLADAAEYIHDGYPILRVFREYNAAPYSPADLALKLREKLMKVLNEVYWRQGHKNPVARNTTARSLSRMGYQLRLIDAPASSAEAHKAVAEMIMQRLKQEPGVVYVMPVNQDGNITSIEVTRADGGYDRIIVDHAFFKAQQARLWPRNTTGTGCSFVPSQVYLRTFKKVLDLVVEHRLKMVVNYIEDAPGSWTSDSERRCAKQFVLDTIVPMLQQRGISFIGPDFYPRIGFSNDWYFDNSHLTTEGAAMYSQMLGADLKQVLAQRGW